MPGGISRPCSRRQRQRPRARQQGAAADDRPPIRYSLRHLYPPSGKTGRAKDMATVSRSSETVCDANLWFGCVKRRPKTAAERDRKSVVEGKRVSVSLNLGGRRIIKKKT